MEVLTFILQRFYWGLGAGCIINFFFIINYNILIDKITLPKDLLFINDIKYIPNEISILIFVIGTVLVGILLEGISEIGCQYFNEKRGPMYKSNHDRDEKDIYKKLKFIGRLFFFIFRETTTIEVCANIGKEEKTKEENNKKRFLSAFYDFMRDPEFKGDVSKAMQICAKRIVKEEANNGVYIFKDLSFMIQLMRFAFLITALMSFLVFCSRAVFVSAKNAGFFFYLYLTAFIISLIFILIMTPIIIPFYGKKYIRNIGAVFSFSVFFAIIIFSYIKGFDFFLWWYSLSWFFSMLFFLITTHIAVYFGKRYVRDIGTSYNAFKIKISKRNI